MNRASFKLRYLFSFWIYFVTFPFGAWANEPLSELTSEQQMQYKELVQILRCPKCQNNNISDSNAPLAQDLRQKVYQMTKEGSDKQTIVDYMVARYGQFVTYDPPVQGSTLILWLGPFGVIALGGLVLWRIQTRNNLNNNDENESKEWTLAQQEELELQLKQAKSQRELP